MLSIRLFHITPTIEWRLYGREQTAFRKRKGEETMNEKSAKEKRKSILQKVFLGLIFVVGLSIFLYPTITSFINARIQSQIITAYKDSVAKLEKEEKARLRKQALEYNERLTGSVIITDPFDEARPQSSGVSYMDMLNIGEVMAYVEIPKIDVHLPVYHGTSDDVLNNGLGHIEQTSLPIGGLGTNSVITGHRGLPTAKMFRNLDKVKVGDEFYIHSLEEVMAYEVLDVTIVPPKDIERLKIEEDKDIVTLITCDPYMINTNRLLVRGIRTEYVAPAEYAQGGEEAVAENTGETILPETRDTEGTAAADDWMILIAAVLSIAGIVLIYLAFHMRKDRGKKVIDHEA